MICSRWRRVSQSRSERSARARVDRGVDAHEIPRGVDQRAPRIAGVDRGVGLDEVLELLMPSWLRPRAETMPIVTVCPNAERVADGEHTSPTRSASVSPKVIAEPAASTWSTAMSVSGSEPTALALSFFHPMSATSISSAASDDVVIGEDVAL